MQEITYRPIGTVRSPFLSPKNMPVQPLQGRGIKGKIEIYPEYRECLRDLEGFSHIIVLFHLHLSKGWRLLVKPYMEETERGLFSTRSPHRPNPIGLSVVRLVSVEDWGLNIEDIDMVDGSPVLDIKPYSRELNGFEEERNGWMKGRIEKLRDKKPY